MKQAEQERHTYVNVNAVVVGVQRARAIILLLFFFFFFIQPKNHMHACAHHIPAGGVRAADREVHKFQNREVKHPLLKRRLDYFTGVSIRGRRAVKRALAPHKTIKPRLWEARRRRPAKIRAAFKTRS